MQKLLAIAWNHIRLEFQDRSTIVFFLILPLVFTIVIGGALGGSSVDDNRIAVAFVDEDRSALSAQLQDTLDTSTVIRVMAKSVDEANKLLEDKSISAKLTVPMGFGNALMAGQSIALKLQAAPGDSNVLAVQQAVDSAASQVGSAALVAQSSISEALSIKPFASEADRQAYFDQSLKMAQDALKNPPARTEVTQAPHVNLKTADGNTQGSAGQLVTWVLITLIGASEFLVNERLGGTLRRLAVTPTSKSTILLGNILGRLGMGIVQMILLIGFGALVLKVNWGQSPAALALIVVSFALAAVALGVMLGTFVTTRSQAGSLTVLFSMLFAALGGCWWPLEITPTIYQTVVKALPTTWAMSGFTDVIVRSKGVADILPNVLILLGFAAVFFFIGVRRMRFD